MFRWGLAALWLGCLLVGPAEGQRKPVVHPAPRTPAKTAVALPAFTFKAARAGETMNPNDVGSCSPSDDGIAGKLRCRGSDSVVAGIDLLVAPGYYFYNGRLTSMLFLYDNDGASFLTFLSAFRDKYGTPCSTTTEKWQSKGGANLDNETATWCFKTGKLKLERIGPSLKYGVVAYNDDYSGPSKEVPKDF